MEAPINGQLSDWHRALARLSLAQRGSGVLRSPDINPQDYLDQRCTAGLVNWRSRVYKAWVARGRPSGQPATKDEEPMEPAL